MKYRTMSMLVAMIGTFTISSVHGTTMLLGEESITLESKLLEYDYNYTRSTEIFWTSATHLELQTSGKNTFPFTTLRTTLFIENGLYMYTTDGVVNSGYYSKVATPNQMNRYVIEGGYHNRNVVEATFTSDGYSGGVNVNEYYVGMHMFRQTENLANLVSLFGAPSIHEGTYTWSSSDLSEGAITLKNLMNQDITIDLATAFLYFTAPTYTNPTLDGYETPYYTFSEVRIVFNASGDLIFQLFANETAKLQNAEGLFASATITNNGTTTINCLNSRIAS